MKKQFNKPESSLILMALFYLKSDFQNRGKATGRTYYQQMIKKIERLQKKVEVSCEIK
jgi:hypothetical protein